MNGPKEVIMYVSLAARIQEDIELQTKTLQGREYLVVPVIAMIEGVRHGAAQKSGELGLASEFGKFPDGWNTSPVVMNHPKRGSEYISASEPSVLEEYSFGLIFNTQLDGKKLKMEAWLDTSLKDKSDDIARVFERIEDRETIEVSVGFFTEVEDSKGKFKGQAYSGVWRSIVPDHLAFLSEGTIGACSVEDGCGTPRVNATVLSATSKGRLRVNCDCKDKMTLMQLAEQELQDSKDVPVRALHYFIAQAIPSDMLSIDVMTALRSELSKSDDCYVGAFTQTHAVYTKYDDGKFRMYRQSFAVDNEGKVTLGDDAEEIMLMTRIVPAQGTDEDIDNQPKEDDMPENKPKAQDGQETPAVEPTKEVETTPEAPAAETPAEPVAQTASKAVTAQEYVAQAPAEIREVLQTSLNVHQERKAQLIKDLKDTGRCGFDDAYLKAQTLEVLEGLQKLANTPSYEGRAAPAPSVQKVLNYTPAPSVFGKKAQPAA
jgi:hypothetical protein